MMTVSRPLVERELLHTMSVFDVSLFIFRDHGGGAVIKLEATVEKLMYNKNDKNRFFFSIHK